MCDKCVSDDDLRHKKKCQREKVNDIHIDAQLGVGGTYAQNAHTELEVVFVARTCCGLPRAQSDTCNKGVLLKMDNDKKTDANKQVPAFYIVKSAPCTEDDYREASKKLNEARDAHFRNLAHNASEH